MVPIWSSDTFVVDSWPLLEVSRRRRSLERFEAALESAAAGSLRLLMSGVNLGEYFYLAAKDFGSIAAEQALASVAELPIHVISVNAGDGMLAARLKARYSLSYADCFCANLAITHSVPVLTGDPDFRALSKEGVLQLEWMGA